MKKRIIALALAVVLCAGLQPEPVMAAEGSVLRAALSGIVKTKNRSVSFLKVAGDYFKSPLLNLRTMNDRTFMNEYVYKQNSDFSSSKYFKLKDYSSGNMARPEENMADAYNNEYYTYNDKQSWFVTYEWNTYDEDDNWRFVVATREGEISYLINADLRHSVHRHLKTPGWHSKLDDLAQAVFFYNGNESNQIDMLMNNSNQSTSWNNMSTGWKTLPSNAANDTLDLMLTHNQRGKCLCGASSVRRPIIVFADTVAPRISSVSVAKTDGAYKYYYNKPGDMIRFTVYFSEMIRRSDGVTGKSLSVGDDDMNYKVKLAAYDRETRESKSVYANLVEATQSTLIFEYTVPEKTDIIITGLAGADMQKDCILKGGGDFKMYTNRGTFVYVKGNSGDNLKSTATFCDYAGNGIDVNWRGASFSHEIHVDTIDPEYKGTIIESGSMLRDQDQTKLEDGWNKDNPDTTKWPEDIDRSQVFAGVGDWIDLAVDFKEELRTFQAGKTGAANGSADAAKFKATLNILDENNKPVTLEGETIFSRQETVNNNRLLSRLRFKTLNITDGMKPDPDNIGPIKIVKLELTDGTTTVYDMCGNEMEINAIELANPDKQEWLDTLKPGVTTGQITTENYTDDGYGATEGVKIPLQITERSYDGLTDNDKFKFISGTAGVGTSGGANSQSAGSIFMSGTNGAIYQYAVTTKEDTPTNWVTVTGDAGLSFPQLDSTVYLNLRLAKSSELPLNNVDLKVTAYDYAGNMGSAEIKNLTANLKEQILPKGEASFTVGVDHTVKTHIAVQDRGGLTDVRYKFVVNAVDKVENKPQEPTTENDINDEVVSTWDKLTPDEGAQTVEADVTYEQPLEGNKITYIYLLLYATDASGNTLKMVIPYQHDMRMPSYDVTIPAEITGNSYQDAQEKIEIGLMDIEKAKEIAPVQLWNQFLLNGKGEWLHSYGALYVAIQREQKNPNDTLIKLVDEILDTATGEGAMTTPNNPIRDYKFSEITDLFNDLTALEIEEGTTHHTAVPVGWGYYTVGELINIMKGTGHEITNNGLENVATGKGDEKPVIEDFQKNYYGNLNIYLAQLDAQTYDSSSYTVREFSNTDYVETIDCKPAIVTKYTVKVKMDDGNTDKNPINKATFEPPIAANGEVLAQWSFDYWAMENRTNLNNEAYTPISSPNITAFKTLAGITVPFTVGNNRVEEWGIEDIDFTSDDTIIQVWYSPDPWEMKGMISSYEGDFGTEPVEEFELTPDSAEQSFTFPETIGGQPYKTGVYKVVVKLKTKSFNHVDTTDSSNAGKKCSFIFRVFAPTPTINGGIHSVFIGEGETLIGQSDKLSASIKEDEFTGDSFDGKAQVDYTIPLIRSVDADGEETYSHFIPFFTYQNDYVNSETDVPMMKDLIQLKVWVDGEEEKFEWIKYTDQLSNSGAGGDQSIRGFTFNVITAGDSNYSNGLCDYRFTITPGVPLTLCMQEYYANGEVGNIQKLTVNLPDPEAVVNTEADESEQIEAGTLLTPNVDVTCATGTPTETVSIGVNDISSVNGSVNLHVSPGGLRYWSRERWKEAEIQEVEVKQDAKDGVAAAETTTRSVLAVQCGNDCVPEFGGDSESKQLLVDLHTEQVDVGWQDVRYANPVIVAVDGNYNTTVREVGDLIKDWDPDGTWIFYGQNNMFVAGGQTHETSEGEWLEDGRYSVSLRLTDTFLSKNMEGMTFYISTVDPRENSADSPEEGGDTIAAANTIAIPFSDLAKGDEFTTVYDGSTPNAPGVTGIKVEQVSKPQQEDFYGNDWSVVSSNYKNRAGEEILTIPITITGSQPRTNAYMYCVDELGHMSGIIIIPADQGDFGEFNEPKVAKTDEDKDDISRDKTDGTLTVRFTQDVMLIDPEIPSGDYKLTTEKTGIPIYQDGEYTLKFMDIFGRTYEQTITVALDGNYKFGYTMTPDELTNGDVEFTIQTQDYNKAETTIEKVVVQGPNGEAIDAGKYEIDFSDSNKKTATVTMHENGRIVVTLGYGEEKQDRIFNVTNIDKTIDDVAVAWEYDANDVYKMVTDEENGQSEYEYDEDGNRVMKEPGSTTQGNVTAVLYVTDPDSDEELTGVNGELRYTFTNGAKYQDKYEFKYRDAAGNEGSKTVELQYNIELPVPPRLTGYRMNISHTADTETYNDMTFGYTAGAMVGADIDTPEEERTPLKPPEFNSVFTNEDGSVTQAKEILINFTTDLDAAVYVLAENATEEDARAATGSVTVDGVTVFGKNVKVTKNAKFTIAVVEDPKYLEAAQKADPQVEADKSPRKVYLIPVDISNIPVLNRESISITYMQKSTYEVWAYLNPGDDNYRLTVTNAIGDDEVRYDEERQLYYHIFKRSGSYTFHYKDGVGNTGDMVASVSTIPDNVIPTVETTRWWPYKDKDHQDEIKEGKVNYDVTLQLTYNMLIQEASISTNGTERLSTDDLEALKDKVEIEAALNTVTVTFHENYGPIYVWVKGETDEEAYSDKIEAVSIIDKVAPEVTATLVKPKLNDKGYPELNEDKTPLYEKNTDPARAKSAYLQFTPTEPVVCNDVPRELVEDESGKMVPKNEGYYDVGDPMILYVTENGTYSYTFIDEAGNTCTAEIEVTHIDNEAPAVTFSKTGDGEGKSWEEFAEGEDVTQLDEVYVKPSEKCTLIFQGKDYELTPDNAVQLTINLVKGGFVLTLADVAGNATVVPLTGIQLKDVTAPKLFVSPQSISIKAGLKGDELESALWEGVSWSDDMTEQKEVDVKCESASLQANVPGQYVIYFTATDKQNNKTTVERYVRVYPATSLMLRVHGGNETEFKDTAYMNTTILTSGNVAFELLNLRGSAENKYEPFNVYVKKGMKTAGQMKNVEKCTDAIVMNESGSGMTWTHDFGGAASGYYTVYILTQDRTSYLTYLYIEQ